MQELRLLVLLDESCLCYEDKLAKLTKCFDGYSRRYQFRGVKLLCLVMTHDLLNLL